MDVRLGPMLLGDLVEAALRKLGVTSEGISRRLGRPCRCKERKEVLNAVDLWARQVLFGKGATKDHLDGILEAMPEDEPPEPPPRKGVQLR